MQKHTTTQTKITLAVINKRTIINITHWHLSALVALHKRFPTMQVQHVTQYSHTK